MRACNDPTFCNVSKLPAEAILHGRLNFYGSRLSVCAGTGYENVHTRSMLSECFNLNFPTIKPSFCPLNAWKVMQESCVSDEKASRDLDKFARLLGEHRIPIRQPCIPAKSDS